MAVVALAFLVIASLSLLGYQLYTTFLQPGAIYYPTTDETVEVMLKLGDVKRGELLVDLGSGDGKILIAAAQRGARAIGYEIDPFLVRRSRAAIRAAGVEGLAEVRWKSFWQADLKGISVVMVYLFPHLMNRLYRMVQTKGERGVKLVCNDYAVPGVACNKQIKKVYLYTIGKEKKSEATR